MTHRSPRHGWVHPLVIVLYTLLTGAMTWPLATQLTTAIPGDSFDGWQNYWNLWWIKVALVERIQNPFFTDLLYAPTGVGLYFHTLNPFNGVVTLPVQLGVGLMLAYNSVVWISWVLGGYGAFLLTLWVLRRPGTSPMLRYSASFLAGAIFTFSPFHMAHLLGHMQVMSLQWMPFYVLYLLRGIQKTRANQPWLHEGILAGIFLTLVGLCDWYFVLYLFLFTALVLFWQLIADIRTRGLLQLKVLYPAITAGSVFLLLLSPILIPMISEALRFSFMERPASDLYILSVTLADFVIPNRLHTLFRPESFTWLGNQIAPVSERTVAIGYVAIVLTVVAALRDRRRSGLWLTAAVLFILIALGPSFELHTIDWDDVPQAPPTFGWTPYEVLNEIIPFMRISRSVSRFAVVVQMSLAVAAAIGLTALLRKRSPRIQVTVAVLALAAVLAEYWVAPYPISPPDTPEYYTQIAMDTSTSAVLNLPMNYDRPGYLLYQTVHQKPLSVAYISRDDPRTFTERTPVLQHFRHLGADILDVDPAQLGATVFSDLDVDWVILDRYKMPGGLERSYTSELAASIFSGVTPVYEDDRITVYRTQLPPVPQAYPLLGPTGWGPLASDEEGNYRQLVEGTVLLTLRHVPLGAVLQIDYRSKDEVVFRAVTQTSSNSQITTLPAAPDGSVFNIPLDSLRALPGTEATERVEMQLVFESIEPSSTQIRSIQIR
ncbi:hypothetical protein GC175_28625 [bacterium]|nr:hypothetical protein [bacterium]